ncbi:C40 family peptidase [Paenibacillus sp. YYML68]|uniref:C40 family peptidase n=1 Tax=Paenibacillus sp. YYML68 TaxID=2909250 RepID=UPI002490A776|nr:C40 family peptidase [Paenibacillus sp. YYML68]
MKKKLLSVILSAAIAFAAVPFQATAYYVEVPRMEVVQGVNFRTQPTTTSERIRFLKTGEQLELVNTYNSYWLEVRDAAGVTGFVSSSDKYVKSIVVKEAVQPNATIVSSVSFRTGPSTSDARLRYLSEGEQVLVLEQVNSYWYKVMDASDVIGYVSSSERYIETTFNNGASVEVEQEEILFPEPPNATAVSSVSFRTEPTTDSTRIRYISKGEELLVLDKYNQYWFSVQDKNGDIGYVSTSSKYISTTYVEPYKSLTRAAAVQQVIDTGMKYVGVPYEFGSSRTDTTTFDCSDFVRQAFMEGIGQQLPSNSRTQGSHVKAVGKTSTDWSKLRKGDLLFFMSYKGNSASKYAGIDKSKETITHVGIYLGDGTMLHTYSEESGGVRIDRIAGTSWEHRFLFGGATY